jgi:hypothetical protein
MKLSFAFVASGARLSLSVLALTLAASLAFAETAPEAVRIQTPVTCGTRIEAPGAYFLTQDLDCSDLTNAGRPAVEIVAGNVQFDLSGFTLRGAISVSDATRVRIANGKVDVFAGIISMATVQFTNVQNSRVERLTVRNAGSVGAGLSIYGGGNNLIRENDIRSSGEAIFLGNSAVGDSIIRNYIGGTGIGLGVADTVRDTVIISNEIDGSDMGAASIRGTGILLEDCRVHHPLSVSGDRNRIRNNTITGPDRRTLLGISGTGNLIQGNVVTNSSDMVLPAGGGIYVGGSGNVIRANTVSGATAPEVDLSGPENTCTENRWRNNTFSTASPDCIR